MVRCRVELFEQIRRDQRREGLSIRELAERHRVHRRTVRQALDNAVPPPRKAYARRPRPAIDAYVEMIDGWLLADREVPRKQRHTARRVWQRLVAEHGACLAEVTVSRYVARRRVELGLDRVEVAVPQTHVPGAEAEVDFGEFSASGRGLVKVWMFVMRLSHSGRAFHVAFGNPGAGGVLRRTRARVRAFRGGAGPDPLRQPETGGGSGAARAGPGRVRAVHRVAQPLWLRLVLLQSRHGRRA